MTSQRTVAVIATSVLLLCLSAAPTLAQVRSSGVEASAAFGGASLDGIPGGLPPAAGTIMGALRLSIGAPVRDVRLSAETELNMSGRVSGHRFVPGGIDNQARRDLLWSILGGAEISERHGVGSLHVSAGISRVTPLITAHPSLDPNISYHSTRAPTIRVDSFIPWSG